jgi:hypothetical protein
LIAWAGEEGKKGGREEGKKGRREEGKKGRREGDPWMTVHWDGNREREREMSGAARVD